MAIFILIVSPAAMIGYSYWDDLSNDDSNQIQIGSWWGTAISTAQEFFDFATKTNSTADDVYYLNNDIDFTGFNWILDASNYNATFRGTLDGNGMTISNLTITTTTSSNSYIGIFPIMQGGSVSNLILSNVNIQIGYSYSSVQAGLIAGNISGLTNTIENITINNAGVIGNSTNGTGGLVGKISNSGTTVNITNIKATDLKVFSTSSYVGGIVGYISSSYSYLNVSDIDVEGEVSSMSTSSYTGGVLGYANSSTYFHLNRAIVNMTSQNTLVSSYYLDYSTRYMGGFIGYNKSTSDKIIMENSFFTGSLVSSDTRRPYYIGTAVGRSSGSETLNSAYYSMVLYMETNGTLTYTPSYTPRGTMATLVNASTMPSLYWWDTFALSFVTDDNLWSQDSITGQLYLDR